MPGSGSESGQVTRTHEEHQVGRCAVTGLDDLEKRAGAVRVLFHFRGDYGEEDNLYAAQGLQCDLNLL